jgi:hypothetical protein
MGLIKKISEMRELRKEEKELRQEERLILREMAQERLNKKHALSIKQERFDNMLDMCFPSARIIDLQRDDGQVEYFLMDTNPFTAILFLQEGVPQKIKFKQLTGKDAGKIYVESKYDTLLFGAVGVMNKGYSVGLFDLSSKNKGKLRVSINGYINESIDQHFAEDTELEKIYGKTMTLRQLLIRWKTDNRKFMNIDLETDYEMVKRVYDSEDILAESKSEELSK